MKRSKYWAAFAIDENPACPIIDGTVRAIQKRFAPFPRINFVRLIESP